MFNLNDLQIKAFDEFIVDPLSNTLQEKKFIYNMQCCWNWKKSNYRSYK